MARRIAAGAPLPGIEHLVVVMLENRSFDNVLGMLYAPSSSFDGVPLNFPNEYRDFVKKYTVYPTNDVPSGNSIYVTPMPDPGETNTDMHKQIFGYHKDSAPMSGFAQNYSDVLLKVRGNAGDVMVYFTPAQLPVTSFLATFAVSDQWFASGPVQTFPNRMFCHCGTPGLSHLHKKPTAALNDPDYLVHALKSKLATVYGSVPDPSIFQLLDGTGGPDPSNWKVYFHDAPLSALNEYVYNAWNASSPCVSSFNSVDYDPKYGTTFLEDVIGGNLPIYSFIEPRYFSNYSTEGLLPNSNHPGSSRYVQYLGSIGGPDIDVRQGELLLLDIYATLLLNYDLFKSTLLVVTYDEHGGLFDHVPPGSAVSPFASAVADGDTYDMFGVRVPTFFVNPAIPPGTIYRPPQGSSFDHTSIIATLCAQFGLDGPLTARDGAAPVLKGLIPSTPKYRSREELAPPASLEHWSSTVPTTSVKAGPRKTVEQHQAMMAERLRHKAK